MVNKYASLPSQELGQALKELLILEQDARDFGFDWPNLGMIIKQAISECAEITEAIVDQEPPVRVQEEIGDLLHTALSMCVFQGYDFQEIFTQITQKFGKRMQILKSLTKEHGLPNLNGQSIESMLELWEKAKLIEE